MTPVLLRRADLSESPWAGTAADSSSNSSSSSNGLESGNVTALQWHSRHCLTGHCRSPRPSCVGEACCTPTRRGLMCLQCAEGTHERFGAANASCGAPEPQCGAGDMPLWWFWAATAAVYSGLIVLWGSWLVSDDNHSAALGFWSLDYLLLVRGHANRRLSYRPTDSHPIGLLMRFDPQSEPAVML